MKQAGEVDPKEAPPGHKAVAWGNGCQGCVFYDSKIPCSPDMANCPCYPGGRSDGRNVKFVKLTASKKERLRMAAKKHKKATKSNTVSLHVPHVTITVSAGPGNGADTLASILHRELTRQGIKVDGTPDTMGNFSVGEIWERIDQLTATGLCVTINVVQEPRAKA